MCSQFPPPAQPFQRMSSAPAGHGGSGGGGGGGPGGGGGSGGGGYHRQHSDPCMPYLQQSFKQEYLDPLYERAAHMAGSGHRSGPGHGHGPQPHPHSHPHRFPPAHMMVKQEPTDYPYDPGEFPATLISHRCKRDKQNSQKRFRLRLLAKKSVFPLAATPPPLPPFPPSFSERQRNFIEKMEGTGKTRVPGGMLRGFRLHQRLPLSAGR